MNWFKTLWLTSEERKAIQEYNKIKQENSELSCSVRVLEAQNTFLNVPKIKTYYSDNTLTVVYADGEVKIVSDVDENTYTRIKRANSEDEIKTILSGVISKVNLGDSKEEIETVSRNLDILKNHPEFTVIDKSVYLKGVSLSLPVVVIVSFIEILEKMSANKGYLTPYADIYSNLDEQFQALKMFWLKLALNGIEQSRLDLLNFVRKNDVRITRNGNLVLYRRIVSVGTENKKLVEFISQEYYKIKKKWKKSPDHYYVWAEDDGSYSCIHGKCNVKSDGLGSFVGYLGELYKELPNMSANSYTSAHNAGKHTIKIGEIYRIDESGINLDNGLCAAGGLHAAAVDYNYSGFGDTPVVVLVNPSKAITVPTGETGKLRTTEMFVALVNDKPQGTHYDEDALSAFDEEYNNISIEELEEAIANKSFVPATVKEEVSPITFVDLNSIKNMLKNRVVKI